MGYYSEVALCLNKEAHEQFQEALTKQDDNIKIEVVELLKSAELMYMDGSTLYYWNSLKWYQDFSCVGFVEPFLNSLPEEMEEHYAFTRIGESLDDNEERGGYWENPFDLCVDRNISFAYHAATT